MKTERMTFVTTRDVKASIMKRARRLDIPASELIRRAVEKYDPDHDEALLLTLADELDAANRRTAGKLDSAIAAVERTVARLAQENADAHA